MIGVLKPVIFRATPQWFASISKVRQDILDAIEDTDFKVDWGKTRIYNMIRDRGEWVISRQRVWGVPLPVFYAENGDIIMTKETVNHIADLFAEHGSNIWFEREAKDLLPEGFTHPGSPNGEFTKETDIMDVWFDSGSSHRGVLENRPELSSQLTYTLKVVTNIVVGLTLQSLLQLQQEVKHHINSYYLTVSYGRRR